MLLWLILPFYDFCSFQYVAVNSVYKLQFFNIYIFIHRAHTSAKPEQYLFMHFGKITLHASRLNDVHVCTGCCKKYPLKISGIFWAMA